MRLKIVILFLINFPSEVLNYNQSINFSWFINSTNVKTNLSNETLTEIKNKLTTGEKCFYSVNTGFKAWFHDHNSNVILLNEDRNDLFTENNIKRRGLRTNLLDNNETNFFIKALSTLFEDWKLGWKFIFNLFVSCITS